MVLGPPVRRHDKAAPQWDNPFNSLDALNGLIGSGTTGDDVDGANNIIFVYGAT
jgi:hypothetical protein